MRLGITPTHTLNHTQYTVSGTYNVQTSDQIQVRKTFRGKPKEITLAWIFLLKDVILYLSPENIVNE